jgi:Helix-turn-helix domain of resolvase
MAKLKRKQRLKKQIIKRNKQLSKEQVKQAAAPIKKEIPRQDLFVGKYVKENETYQKQLDEVYNGTIVPIERYINAKANLLHICTECQKEFFSKPVWLLAKQDQKHVCEVNTLRANEKKVRKIGDKEKAKMVELSSQGMSTSKIAMHLGISRPTIIKYLKEAGIS